MEIESLIYDYPEPPEIDEPDEFENDDQEYEEALSDSWDKYDN